MGANAKPSKEVCIYKWLRAELYKYLIILFWWDGGQTFEQCFESSILLYFNISYQAHVRNSFILFIGRMA